MSRYLLLIIGVVVVLTSQAQVKIEGRVTGPDKSGLLGATISFKGTTTGTTADADGHFTLEGSGDSLVVSYIGMESQTIAVPHSTRKLEIEMKEEATELVEVVKMSTKRGMTLDKKATVQTEHIGEAGLQKMACCSVAESFENSASVTVGFADAISGARQIKMLGLSGTYTQLLDESRPIMQGLGAPFALNYTPGDWLAGISISKGVTSVVSGHEAITGQINMDYRKPHDREKLHINAYLDDQLRPELNLTSALTLDKQERLQTIIFAHGSGDTDVRHEDMNKDGFRDQPTTWAVNVANKWGYVAANDQRLHWGWKYTHENRQGGQMKAGKDALSVDDYKSLQAAGEMPLYGSRIQNDAANVYFKWAIPMGKATLDWDGDERRNNIAFVLDYDYFRQRSHYGLNQYSGTEHAASMKVLYNHYFNARNTLMVGGNWKTDIYKEALENRTPWNVQPSLYYDLNRIETEAGVHAEYTYSIHDKLTVQAGVRGDYNHLTRQVYGTPRLHLKWNITKTTTLRASAGTGYRVVKPITDNIGVLATGRSICFDGDYQAEQAYNAGISLMQQINLGGAGLLTLSADYYRTQFWNALIVDQEQCADKLMMYYSQGRNYTDTWQVDATWVPVERLEIYATFRYNNSKYTIDRINPDDGTEFVGELVERPLMGRFKTLLNIRYATKFNKWIFDATAQVNGKSRIPTQTGDLADASYSPVFPMFYAQVTHKIKKWDLYFGCENIGNYTQKTPVLSADNPWSNDFNSMNVWGPLMGRKFYVGLRWNLY